ncbi:hypothetical protein HOK51_03670 [Candidatus Woesearchaeota archaeon]|nr:hypothetical protein [Candidatus Woesearchaeota archaeon]MBT6518920.1 hypothetical protein [Candidatus Woesearchaeota archaeon]MBT7367588.1 hypothetical protein [Candidatus Woesearchaeota archaeon]
MDNKNLENKTLENKKSENKLTLSELVEPKPTLTHKIVGLVFLIAMGGFTYKSCFAPRSVENVKVIDKGSYTIVDHESGYEEEQTTITVEGGQCFRDPKPFGDNIHIGNKIKKLTYRPGIIGPCDYVIDYKMNYGD